MSGYHSIDVVITRPSLSIGSRFRELSLIEIFRCWFHSAVVESASPSIIVNSVQATEGAKCYCTSLGRCGLAAGRKLRLSCSAGVSRVVCLSLASNIYQEPRLTMRNFAQTFDSGQEQRISLDDDRTARFPRSQVMYFIDRTGAPTNSSTNVPPQTRRALAVYLLVRWWS